MAHAIAVVDPFSSGSLFAARVMAAGTRIYRVLSCRFSDAQLAFVPPGVSLPWAETLQFEEGGGGLNALVAQLRPLGVTHVVAGSEPGVELADALSEALALPSNGTALSACRRDKFLMQQRLHECGMDATRHLLVSADTPPDEVRAFLRSLASSAASSSASASASASDADPSKPCDADQLPPPSVHHPRVVVKPTRASGSDGVSLCHSEAAAFAALTAVVSQRNQLGALNAQAVVEEFVTGVELVVDSVSLDGAHKTVAVWEYDKRTLGDAAFVYSGMRMLAGADPRVPALTAYAHRVLDALGVRHGPSHAEIMWDETRDSAACSAPASAGDSDSASADGSASANESVSASPASCSSPISSSAPRLIEVGARLHGAMGSFVAAAQATTGTDQIEVCRLALTDAAAFVALPSLPPAVLLAEGMQAFLISTVVGTVAALPQAHLIRARASFRCMNLVAVGDRVQRTVNGWTSPGNVTLVHACARVLKQDYEFIVDLVMRPDFFQLE